MMAVTNNNDNDSIISVDNLNDDDITDDENEVSCTMCMTDVKQGDRIGALACNHTFHVDYLKQWLCRRNVCPLYLTPNIASSRRCTQDDTSSNRRGLVVNPDLPIDWNSPTPPPIPRRLSTMGSMHGRFHFENTHNSFVNNNGLQDIRRDLFNFDRVASYDANDVNKTGDT